MKSFLLLLLLTALIMGGFYLYNQKHAAIAEVYFQQAERKASEGDYPSALLLYGRAYAESKQPRFLFNRAQVELKLGELDKAIEDITMVIRWNPQRWNYYLDRAMIKAGQGRSNAAITDINSALRIDPNQPELYIQRGRLYADGGQNTWAENDAEDALQLDPKPAEKVLALALRGRVKAQEGSAREALRDLDEVLKTDPKNSEAWAGRSLARLGLGDPRGAFQDAGTALALNGRSGPGFMARGEARLQLEDYAGAQQDLAYAAQLLPGNESIQNFLAIVGQALHAFQTVQTLAPAMSPQDYPRLAEEALAKQENWMAIAWATKALGVRSRNQAQALLIRARANLALQQYPPALADADRCARAAARDPGVYSLRGEIRLKLQDFSGALADANQGLRISSNFPGLYALRAQARAGLKDVKGGIADINQAVGMAPNDKQLQAIRQHLLSLLGGN